MCYGLRSNYASSCLEIDLFPIILQEKVGLTNMSLNVTGTSLLARVFALPIKGQRNLIVGGTLLLTHRRHYISQKTIQALFL